MVVRVATFAKNSVTLPGNAQTNETMATEGAEIEKDARGLGQGMTEDGEADRIRNVLKWRE